MQTPAHPCVQRHPFARLRTVAPHVPAVVLGSIAAGAALIVPLIAGTFWPISVAGRIWREHTTTFSTDSLSRLPIEGGEWVVQPWLVALSLWGAWNIGGATALSLLAAFVSIAIMLLLFAIARGHAAPLPAALATLLVWPLIFPPTLTTQQFAVLLAAAVLLTARGRWFWLAPVLIVIWANVHGSVPIGVALCGAAALGLLRSPTPDDQLSPSSDGLVHSQDHAPSHRPPPHYPLLTRPVWQRALWLGLATLAVLINPLGLGLIDYIRDVSSIPGIRALTPVWRPLSIDSWRGLLVLGLVCIVIVRIVRTREWHWRAALPLVPVVVVLMLAVGAVRHLPWFVVLALPELALALQAVWTRLAWPPRLTSPLIAAALLAACAFALIGLRPGGDLQRGFALNALPDDQLLGFTGDDRLLVSLEWANYVVVRKGGRPSVFADARLERYEPADLQRYVGLTKARRGPLSLLLECGKSTSFSGYTHVLVRHKTAGPLIRQLRRAHSDPTAHGAAQRPVVVEQEKSDGVLFRLGECPSLSRPTTHP